MKKRNSFNLYAKIYARNHRLMTEIMAYYNINSFYLGKMWISKLNGIYAACKMNSSLFLTFESRLTNWVFSGAKSEVFHLCQGEEKNPHGNTKFNS